MLFFQSIFCSNKLKWIKIFNSFQSIFIYWEYILVRLALNKVRGQLSTFILLKTLHYISRAVL